MDLSTGAMFSSDFGDFGGLGWSWVILGGLGQPFSRICRQVQCFRVISVISGGLGWSSVVSGSFFVRFVDRCSVFGGSSARSGKVQEFKSPKP